MSTHYTSIYILKDTPITLVGLASSWRNDTILPSPGKGTNGIVTQAAVPTANHLSALSAVAIREKDWLDCFSNMLDFAFSHHYQQPVALKIRPKLPETFLSRNRTAKATLRIIKVPHVAFTWLNPVEGLLAIFAEWTEIDVWQSTEELRIWLHGNLIATLTFLPGSGAGGLTAGEIVATA